MKGDSGKIYLPVISRPNPARQSKSVQRMYKFKLDFSGSSLYNILLILVVINSISLISSFKTIKYMYTSNCLNVSLQLLVNNNLYYMAKASGRYNACSDWLRARSENSNAYGPITKKAN